MKTWFRNIKTINPVRWFKGKEYQKKKELTAGRNDIETADKIIDNIAVDDTIEINDSIAVPNNIISPRDWV